MKNVKELERQAWQLDDPVRAAAYGYILRLQDGIQDALDLLDGGNATEEQLQALRDLRDGD